MGNEIERKFLVGNVPTTISGSRPKKVDQGYLISADKEEVRLRTINRKSFLTIKKGSGLNRKELEIRLKSSDFKLLWEETEGARLSKTRQEISIDGKTAELDRYSGELAGLTTIEIEFESAAEAFSFDPPDWFGPELTYDPRFKNKALAQGSLNEFTIPIDFNYESPEYRIGVIPYLFKKGECQIVTITSKSKQRIIFPKGRPEPDMTLEEIAKMEGIEEAGVEGRISGHPILVPFESERPVHWLLYPMEVSKIKRSWDEKSDRDRAEKNLSDSIDDPELSHIKDAVSFLNDFISATASAD